MPVEALAVFLTGIVVGLLMAAILCMWMVFLPALGTVQNDLQELADKLEAFRGDDDAG